MIIQRVVVMINKNKRNNKLSSETVIMLLEKEQVILPVSTDAFGVAQSSFKQLNNIYANAVVIWQDGTQSVIERISVEGWCGDSVLAKILSVLIGFVFL